ncbi:VTT domain-containing protein [Alkalibacterium sp. AK22]|uniref:VTT domain-containing protein n=1 Tax=Alkalibacterium sp. AK22 TaxID=1229520 RepID=UPI0005503CCC|nr:VTT domain-containing protein [Alkalibacterium sp. AK22]
MTDIAGVVLFILVIGVVNSYVSISMCFILAFLQVRRYGETALSSLVSQARLQKYEANLTNSKSFSRCFTLITFLPFAPDNVICYLAGPSDMSTHRVILPILLRNPLSVAFYSIGWFNLLQFIGFL